MKVSVIKDWKLFTRELPEINQIIKVDTGREVFFSYCYLFKNEMMIKSPHDSKDFVGCSIKLLRIESKWKVVILSPLELKNIKLKLKLK